MDRLPEAPKALPLAAWAKWSISSKAARLESIEMSGSPATWWLTGWQKTNCSRHVSSTLRWLAVAIP
jgi:hypothetical protein